MTITYPYLPEGRTIQYVSGDASYMREAKNYSHEHSTDRHMPTGAVIVRGGEIIGCGANQVPLTSPWAIRMHKEYVCMRRALRIRTGEKYWLCPGCAQPKDHAEARAIKDARTRGHNTQGADLYLWGHWWCCKDCWDTMRAAGITHVYLLEGSERLFNKSHSVNIIGRQFTYHD